MVEDLTLGGPDGAALVVGELTLAERTEASDGGRRDPLTGVRGICRL